LTQRLPFSLGVFENPKRSAKAGIVFGNSKILVEKENPILS
jgi:hypothetical protein